MSLQQGHPCPTVPKKRGKGDPLDDFPMTSGSRIQGIQVSPVPGLQCWGTSPSLEPKKKATEKTQIPEELNKKLLTIERWVNYSLIIYKVVFK